MKRYTLAGILATICTASVALVGCGLSDAMSYAHADEYSVGSGSVSGAVTEIEIDWIDGNVEISYGDVEEITFSETSQKELSTENTLHYWLENTTLHIKFAQAKKMVSINSYPEKDLKVVLPRELALQKLDIDAVDTQVTIEDLAVLDLEIETVDGDVNAYLVGACREISIETVGGEVYLDSKIAPRELSFEAVGGSLTLGLYEVEGFTFEMEDLGGEFNCDFQTTKKGKSYVYGTGIYKYEAETVGGNVTVIDKSTN